MMKRGAVIIGVNKYNDSEFLDLQAAVRGAKDVAKWARSNGFEVKCITDEKTAVRFEHVQEAVEYFTSRTGDQRLEQLLVYFSGHGLNSGFSETWLLSNAIRNGNEAVNLASTIEMARYTTGIPHVVFISDACRSAADKIDSQNIRGGDAIVGKLKGRSAIIDRFYATRPGNPAMEVKDTADPHGTYEAVYTKCILDALGGTDPSLVEPLQTGLETLGVITSDSLRRYLEEMMPKQVAALKLKRAQNPDAIVESRSPLYLARVDLPSGEKRIGRPRHPLQTPVAMARLDRGSLIEGNKNFVALLQDTKTMPELKTWAEVFSADSHQVLNAMSEDTSAQDLDILVIGADVRAAESRAGVCEVSSTGDHIRIKVKGLEEFLALPVLVEFSDGCGALIGVFYGYRSTLLMDRGELASVTYDLPREKQMLEGDAKERLRALRASVAAAARHGVFRIENEEAREFGDQIRIMKGVDPTLGIYAAYAYHQVGLLERIRSVAHFMQLDLAQYLPFDVAMLLRTPDSNPQELEKVVPNCPMLTQGWALLSAKRVNLPTLVEAAGRHLAPSLWTLFKPEGVRLIREYMSSGEF